MTERQMFEKSFLRPSSYFLLTPEQQYDIDVELGIEEWKGEDKLVGYDLARFCAHYGLPSPAKPAHKEVKHYKFLRRY